MDVAQPGRPTRRREGNARSAAGFEAGDQRLLAAAAALSRRDRARRPRHARGYRRRAGRHAGVWSGKLVPRARRQGAGAPLVRAIGQVRRLAGVRVHRVGGGAAPASVRRTRTISQSRRGSSDKTLKLYQGHFHDLLNDLDREIVLADIMSWIDARLPATEVDGANAPTAAVRR